MSNYQLTNIRLCGTMQGPIWWPYGEICETRFRKDFNPPRAGSTLSNDWPGLDEALQQALACGDFEGGMGDLVDGWLEFRLSRAGGRDVRTVCKSLEDLHGAQDYLAPQ